MSALKEEQSGGTLDWPFYFIYLCFVPLMYSQGYENFHDQKK